DLAEDAAREATLTADFFDDTATLGYVWVGDPQAGQAMLPALRSVGVPDGEVVRELSYIELQTRDDDIEGHAYRRYWKGHYRPELPDAAIRPTVMVIDIDRFKQVNDSVGVAVGDSILLTLARRLGRLLKPQDTLARLGGNQFGLLLLSEREPPRITAFADTIPRTLRA